MSLAGMHHAEPAISLLTFSVAGQDWALPLDPVLEIRSLNSVLSAAAEHRPPAAVVVADRIIAVEDLRHRLGAPLEYGDFTVLIVIRQDTRVLGLIVDAVCEIISVDPEAVSPPPAIGPAAGRPEVAGLARVGTQVFLILDPQRLSGSPDPVI